MKYFSNCILKENDIIVLDEFTSVVNREVAKTGSYAISKAVRKLDKKFIVGKNLFTDVIPHITNKNMRHCKTRFYR